ncbi:MAG: apolipoprotein N-acyltransferase [Clostridiales bacterium]|nr:apolipoprotein N-acyltransferase [Clostridiales bacterium]
MDVAMAVLSGFLTALAFPKFNLFFLAWICLLPLFFTLSRRKPAKAFQLGFISGFVYYAILLYWIPYVPAHYGNLSPVLSVLVYLLLVALMAMFWAAFSFLYVKIRRPFPRLALLLAPFIWIVQEYAASTLLTGFPWGLLGYSQVKNLAFLQVAAVTGVYGLSFLLVFFQSLFVLSITTKKRLPFFLGLAAVLLVHFGGLLTMRKPARTPETFKAAVIQGNVSSDIYWDRISEEEIEGLFERHLDLTRRAHQEGAKIIIWPEFSVPLCFSCPQPIYQEFKKRLVKFVQDSQCTLLLGTNETSQVHGETRYFNTALCLSPNLSITQYHKMHLVPFGEYTPYKSLFSFIEKVTHAIGEVTAGRDHVLHRFEGKSFGSPICYEIIFPDLVRKFAKRGALFLVTITNDGWYGESSAPHQHFQIAVFRAVENRRFLLRAATTGISGIIDPYGRVLSRSELMTQTFLADLVTPVDTLTFYTRWGDLLPYLSLTLASISFILAVVKRAHEGKKSFYCRTIL